MRKILIAIELSGSFDLINVIVGVFCREAIHICSDEIQASLVRSVRRLDGERQAALINYYWENSFKNIEVSGSSSGGEDRKYLIFRKVIMNVLRNCEKPVFLDFMSANVSYLVKLLDVELRVICLYLFLFLVFIVCLTCKPTNSPEMKD